MNALKSLKINKHPKQKKWESKWNSCTRQRLDKTGLKNAEPEIFTSVAEFLNSFLLFSSLHCVELELSISRINLKTIKVDITFFATCACVFCFCSHASPTTPLQPKLMFKKFSLSTSPSLKKVGTSYHSSCMLSFYEPSKKLFCGPTPFLEVIYFLKISSYDSFQTLSNVTWLFLSHRLGCRKTLPNAQQTRGSSSAYQCHHHKFKHKSWSNFTGFR